MTNLIIGITSYKVDKDNRLKILTERCTDSVMKNIHQIGTGMNVRVILIDCMSDLTNVNISKEIRIIKTEISNLSKSWNDLCKYTFYDIEYDYCLLMNNDMILEDNVLNSLMNFIINNPQHGMIYGSEIYNGNISEACMFSCFLIKKEFYEKIGEFDENLSFYANDWDYLERIKEFNDFPFYYKPFIAIHERSSTKTIFEKSEEEIFRMKHENDVEYYREKWKNKGVNLP